jgi:hypothetical protein
MEFNQSLSFDSDSFVDIKNTGLFAFRRIFSYNSGREWRNCMLRYLRSKAGYGLIAEMLSYCLLATITVSNM